MNAELNAVVSSIGSAAEGVFGEKARKQIETEAVRLACAEKSIDETATAVAAITSASGKARLLEQAGDAEEDTRVLADVSKSLKNFLLDISQAVDNTSE